jgi:hypothetical protein
MKRPIGVSVLSLLFIAVSLGAAFSAVSGFFQAPNDPTHEVEAALGLVIAFMFCAVGLGLWTLEEDARMVTIALFSFPAIMLVILLIVDFWNAQVSLQETSYMIVYLGLYGGPAIYLSRPHVKSKFNQLVLLNLMNCPQ